jgi:hypothetical protein
MKYWKDLHEFRKKDDTTKNKLMDVNMVGGRSVTKDNQVKLKMDVITSLEVLQVLDNATAGYSKRVCSRKDCKTS